MPIKKPYTNYYLITIQDGKGSNSLKSYHIIDKKNVFGCFYKIIEVPEHRFFLVSSTQFYKKNTKQLNYLLGAMPTFYDAFL